MQATEMLIERIIGATKIPSLRRRRDIQRELRAHIEDFAAAALAAGHGDNEIECMVLENFGDPIEIARHFDWVYRWDRARLRMAVFVLSTIAVAALSAAGILAAQAGVAAGFGIPFSGRHTTIELLDILATAAVYVGMISVEKLWSNRGFQKVVLAALLGGLAAASAHAWFLVFACAAAVFLRMAQGRTAGWGAAPLCFGIVGWLFWARSPGTSPAAASLASWMVMGLGYQWMTGLAPLVSRGLWNRLQGS